MDLTGMLQAAAGATPTGNPNAWDISYAAYDAGAGAGDISTVATGRTYNASAQDSNNRGISLSPDGTRMYLLGWDGDDVNQYSLSIAWDVSSASYVQNFSVNSQDPGPADVFFKPDGTKMYMVGAANVGIFEYALSTAWDISSASYTTSFSVSSQEGAPSGVWFSSDGAKMFVVGQVNNSVFEYDLSTAWDVSSATYSQSGSLSSSSSILSITFIGDGTELYVGSTSTVWQYSLSTAYDVSTLTYTSSGTLAAQGLFMREDGFLVFACSTTTARTATLGGFSVLAEETAPNGIFFKPDGTKMYIIGNTGDDVNEYDLSTAWDITTASYVQNFSVAAQDIGPTDIVFKDDGLKMYFAGDVGDAIYEYSLSVAWDISSASYVQNFSVASQETQPRGPAFKTDGTKMYVVGPTTDTVYQYSLSTAWDISSASYDSVSFSVAAQDTTPQDLKFKPDGTKMYILGSTGDDVNEYSLSTPWDVSSASYEQNTLVLDGTPTGLFWRDNGEEFFIVGLVNDRVLKYAISST